jgi:GDP-L-fucose synthase
MPTNLYGVNDNFDESTSHVLPAFIRKFHDAKVKKQKSVTVWGTGNPTREFMHVSDMARACVYLLQKFDPTPEQNERGEIFFNVGTGEEISILDFTNNIVSNVIFFHE